MKKIQALSKHIIWKGKFYWHSEKYQMDVSPNLNFFLLVFGFFFLNAIFFFQFYWCFNLHKTIFMTFFHFPCHLTAYSLYPPGQISFLTLTPLNIAFLLLQEEDISTWKVETNAQKKRKTSNIFCYLSSCHTVLLQAFSLLRTSLILFNKLHVILPFWQLFPCLFLILNCFQMFALY